ncbi:MAG: CBS domain-containing protein, partial [Deltaproteobacteria bacterium]|nr:CBS domain-containing protein [Nannocystaceae bacterium]
MSKQHPIPPIRKFMSDSPHTIGVEETMQRAHQVMREFNIRHLPVMEADKLVGMLSDGDLHLVESLRDVDPTKVP